MKKFTIALLVLSLLFAASCRQKATESSYRTDLEKWHTQRLERLKSKTGWLNLAGLFWLEPGANTFGSDSANDLLFPSMAPAVMGTITLTGNQVELTANKAGIRVDSLAVPQTILQTDTTGKPSVMTWGSLSWYIVKRGGRFGIRLRDYDNPLIEALKEIPIYPVDTRWRVTAEYTPFAEPLKQVVQTVIGIDAVNLIPGELTFKLEGRTLKLYPVAEDGGLTLVFGDQTNGEETYGGGRFLDLDAPDAKGRVEIDFNRAYNPPCAFTPYATCQLPHRDNMLPLKIEAGEKAVHLVPGH